DNRPAAVCQSSRRPAPPDCVPCCAMAPIPRDKTFVVTTQSWCPYHDRCGSRHRYSLSYDQVTASKTAGGTGVSPRPPGSCRRWSIDYVGRAWQMTIQIVSVPYRYDDYLVGLGQGPKAMLEHGL